ncbi:MAG TPA: hypothetical protein PKM25_09300, partial [Candidatus Ozemobacteraceae bacterium]|nr:hypothetical protein [Candidatus Ozemobacteraceae bacterium]
MPKENGIEVFFKEELRNTELRTFEACLEAREFSGILLSALVLGIASKEPGRIDEITRLSCSGLWPGRSASYALG